MVIDVIYFVLIVEFEKLFFVILFVSFVKNVDFLLSCF